MNYSIPNSKIELEKQCADAGISLPFLGDLSALKAPLTILGKTAHNRLVYQAMEGCDGTFEGVPDELTLRRYMRFADGGAGIIWFEATAVTEDGRANPRQMYINEKGLAKIEIGVARGKKNYDKRDDIAKRDADRTIEKAMKNRF